MFEKESLNVMENDWKYPQVAMDNPEPESEDVVVEMTAFSMGSTLEVTIPLCEKRLLLGTKVVATPEYDQSNRINGIWEYVKNSTSIVW